MLAGCSLVAHTGDFSVGSPVEDGGAGANESGAGLGDGGAGSSAGGQDVAAADRVASDATDDGMDSPPGEASVASDSGTSGCNVTIARGAIATPNGYQTVLGLGGFTFAFDDRAGSTSCVALNSMCVSGVTAVATAGDWGAAFGFSLDQAMTAASGNLYPVPSNAVGIAVQLSNFPPGTRVAIDHGGVEYCSPLTGAVATAKWPSFNTQCWNNQGPFLSGPPNDATYIHFIVPAIGASRPFDFCVTSIALALGPPGTEAGASTTEAGAPTEAGAHMSSTDAGPDGAVDAAMPLE